VKIASISRPRLPFNRQLNYTIARVKLNIDHIELNIWIHFEKTNVWGYPVKIASIVDLDCLLIGN